MKILRFNSKILTILYMQYYNPKLLNKTNIKPRNLQNKTEQKNSSTNNQIILEFNFKVNENPIK